MRFSQKGGGVKWLCDEEMQKAISVNTLKKSCELAFHIRSIFGVFGRFWGFLIEIDFRGEQYFLDKLYPEVGPFIFTTGTERRVQGSGFSNIHYCLVISNRLSANGGRLNTKARKHERFYRNDAKNIFTTENAEK